MGTIRIEFVPIRKYNLGLLGLDHLHIVFEDENSFINKQDDWYVLEGTHDGSLLGGQLGVLGQDFTTELSAANGARGDELVALIGTPESRGTRIVYQGPDALQLWDRMMKWGVEIQEQQFPYEGVAWPFSASPIMNSSSVVATLLFAIGIDVNNNMPKGIRSSPGTSTILGTTQDDDLQISGSFTQLATGFGQDTLRGSDGGFWPEKFYGGDDDDLFIWSKGENFIHGGQARLPYAEDGLDVIDYTGAGAVHVIASKHAIEHKVPDYISAFPGGSDRLFSIEAATWDERSDIVTAGEGVEFVYRPVEFQLRNSSGGRGDELGLQNSSVPLIINTINAEMVSIQTIANQGLDAGYWVQSAEYLIGSAGNDLIYAGATLTAVDGGEGDDLLDGRLVEAFSYASPEGYDIELYGGDGDDTLVSGTGFSLAAGGKGQDDFILSAMTARDSEFRVEFVILDADASDRLLLPYNFFMADRGGFDGSELIQLRGAPFAFDEFNPVSLFQWGPPSDDQERGNIDFVGRIAFYMDGEDLIISLMQGHIEEFQEDYGPDEPPGPLVRTIIGENDTETFIRVVGWSDGVLGITFPLIYDPEQAANAGDEYYPGYNAAVANLVNPSIIEAPLAARPDAHLPQDIKARQDAISTVARFAEISPFASFFSGPTEDGDVIVMTEGGPYRIYALGGDDHITASAGGDVIDGGAGNDTMIGGRGNDAYFVDSAGDVIIEHARGGFDHVYASIDYTLGDELEFLTLLGTAVRGTGNALRNKIAGNDGGNVLSGEDGDDTLAGNRGDDTLIGGDGGDGYVYEFGDGNDVIIETEDGTGVDVLVFAGQMSAADLRFYRSPAAMDDLVIRFSQGGSITIAGFFSAASPLIEAIEFLSGGGLTTLEIQAAAAQAILSANIAPHAVDDAYIYVGATTFELPVEALLDNDTDLDGDTLRVVSVTALEGSASLANGKITVTAGPGPDPRAVFNYLVSDGEAFSTATAEITFWINEAPTIDSTVLAPVLFNRPANGQINATDPDGDRLLYSVKSGSGPLRGSVSFSANGAFTYTPLNGETGLDTFTLLVSDPFGASVEQTFEVTIGAQANRAPKALNDTGFAVKAGASLTITPQVLLKNDTDADSDTLTLTTVSKAVGGSAAIMSDGSIVFHADAGFRGRASFDYTITDTSGGSDTATVFVTVQPADSGTGAGLRLIGTNRSDRLIGTSGNDYFRGKDGYDVLIGAAGNDTFAIIGDDGLDRIVGGSGFDILTGSAGRDVFYVTSGFSNLSGVERIDGRGGHDILRATFQNDRLDLTAIDIRNIELIDLGPGKDWVRSSARNETFIGGAGQDTFQMTRKSGHDVICDFTMPGIFPWSADRLDLRAWGFDDLIDLQAHSRQAGRHVVISFDADTSVTLKNMHVSSLALLDILL